MTAIVNSQALNGTNADPSVATLGFSPAAGNTLIAVLRASIVVTIDSVTDDDANVWTIDITGDTSQWVIARLSNIPAGITAIHANVSAAAIVRFHVLEVSGLDNATPLQDTSDYAASGEGFSSSHGFEYTTLEANEIVVFGVALSPSQTMTGTGGTTALQIATPMIQGMIYEIISAAETADVTFTLGASSNATGLGVSYSPAGGATSVPVPGQAQINRRHSGRFH